MTTEKTISTGTTPYRAYVYNKQGEGKLVETIEERDALYSTGEWFDSPDVAKQSLKDEIKLTEGKLQMTDAEIERQLTDSPAEIKADDVTANALKQALNVPSTKVQIHEHEVNDKNKDESEHKDAHKHKKGK